MKEQIAKVLRTEKPILAMLHLNGYTPDKVHELAKWEIEQFY